MVEEDVRVAAFAADRISTRGARGFVTTALHDWGCGEIVDDAVLCTSELAANAVLHALTPFEVVVRRTFDGVRVEVLDRRPRQLPVPVPHQGPAGPLAALRVTGRGLQIVASLARRWGITTSPDAKSVWFEMQPQGAPDEPTAPIVVLGAPPPVGDGEVRLTLRGLPVAAAVASGVQVEELIRAVQLGLADDVLDPTERRHFFDLLDRSTTARLPGRLEAFRAAAAGEVTYDLELRVDQDAIDATIELEQLLVRIPLGMGTVATQPTEAVLAFRRDLGRQVEDQLARD